MIEQVHAKFLRYILNTNAKDSNEFCHKVFASDLRSDFFDEFNIKENVFYSSPYSLIFDLAKNYWNVYQSMPTDDVVSHELQARSDLTAFVKADVLEALKEIRQFDPNPHEFKFTEKQVRDNHVRNKGMSVMAKTVDRFEGDPVKAIEYAQNELHRIRASAINEHSENESKPLWQFMEGVFERLSDNGGTSSVTVKFGFMAWDKVYGGMSPGDLGVFAASSGVGKSWFLHELGFNAAIIQKKRVVIFEREMTDEQNGERILAWMTRIPIEKLQDLEKCSELEIKKLEAAHEEYTNKEGYSNLLWIPYERCANVEMVKREIEMYFGDEKPELILGDYIEEMEPVRRHNSDWEAVKEITAGLKRLAMYFKCPVWTATQNGASGIGNANSGVAEVANKAVVKKADVVVQLTEDPEHCYIPPMVGEFTGTPGIINATFVKVRRGPKDMRFPMKVQYDTALIECYEGFSASHVNRHQSAKPEKKTRSFKKRTEDDE